MKFYDMKFWKVWIDIFSDMKWKLIWWFYMIFAATLFFNNTFGSSSIGLWWLSKSIIYILCFILASIRLAKCGKKKPPAAIPTAPRARTHRPGRPLRRIRPLTINIPKPVRGSIYGNDYIDNVDVWCTDLDKNIQKILKRTECNIQKIKDEARKIETRNKVKRDEWDTRYFDIK